MDMEKAQDLWFAALEGANKAAVAGHPTASVKNAVQLRMRNDNNFDAKEIADPSAPNSGFPASVEYFEDADRKRIVRNFAKYEMSGVNTTDRIILGVVPSKLADDVMKKSGIDIHGLNNVLFSDGLRHGARHDAKTGNIPISPDDVVEALGIFNDYDILTVTQKRGENSIKLEKIVENGLTYVAVIGKARGHIFTKNMWKRANKKDGPVRRTDATKAPASTSETAAYTEPSNNYIMPKTVQEINPVAESSQSALSPEQPSSGKNGIQFRLRTDQQYDAEAAQILDAVRSRSIDDIHEEIYNQIGGTSIAHVAASRIRVNIQTDLFEPTLLISNYEYSGQCNFHQDGSFDIVLHKNAIRDDDVRREYDAYSRSVTTLKGVGADKRNGFGNGDGGSEYRARTEYNNVFGGQIGDGEAEGQNSGAVYAQGTPEHPTLKQNVPSKEAPAGASFDSRHKFRLRPALQAGREKIAGVTPEQAAGIVANIKPVALRSLLDPIRMMDRSAATPETRALLYDVLEKPFNEAGGEYGRNLQRHSDAYLAKMRELGIGKKESQAIQRYGEGVYQDRYGESHEYTPAMLKQQFPDTWENIVKAERVTREYYDGYIDALNRMLETVYPDVIEHAESDAASLQKRIDVAKDQVKNQKELLKGIQSTIEKINKNLTAKSRTDTQAYASLQNSLTYQKNRLANAEALLATYEQRITVRETQKAAIEEAIKNGDVLRNRRVERRRDYFHHFKEMEQGVGALVRRDGSYDGFADEIPFLVRRFAQHDSILKQTLRN